MVEMLMVPLSIVSSWSFNLSVARVQSDVHDLECCKWDDVLTVSATMAGIGAVALVLPQPGEYMFGCNGEGKGDPLLVN